MLQLALTDNRYFVFN